MLTNRRLSTRITICAGKWLKEGSQEEGPADSQQQPTCVRLWVEFWTHVWILVWMHVDSDLCLSPAYSGLARPPYRHCVMLYVTKLYPPIKWPVTDYLMKILAVRVCFFKGPLPLSHNCINMWAHRSECVKPRYRRDSSPLTFILLMWNIWWAANNASTTNV
jgi:hypothetical protein